MKCRFVLLSVCLAGPFLAAQPSQHQLYREAHGGAALERATKAVLSGTLQTPGGQGAFVLKISGEASRLETGGFVSVFSEGLHQWRRPGQENPGPVRGARPGMPEAWLMPFQAVLRLERDFRHHRLEGGRDSFARGLEVKRFVGAGAEVFAAVLEFDIETGLLAEARFEPLVEGSPTPPVAIAYSDYRRVRGVAVPFRVVRTVGERVDRRLTVESVEFPGEIDPGEFEIVPRGGAR